MIESFKPIKYKPDGDSSSLPSNDEIIKPIETQSKPQEIVIDENTNNVVQIILNNFPPEVFDYYFDISDSLSRIDKYKDSFVGSFPNYDTFTSIPLPTSLLERIPTNIHINSAFTEQLKVYLSKISEFESPSRAEYPFIISGSTTQKGDLILESLSIIEDPTPRELSSFTISNEAVSNIDEIISRDKNMNLNTIVFCHNHPKTKEEEISNSLAFSLDQKTKDRYNIQFPGYNLSTADIEQFIFLRSNTFANSKTGVRFLYGVFLPDSEFVLLDVIEKDGEEIIVRIN